MLDIGQERIQSGLSDWLADEGIRDEYPNFRSYLLQVFGI